MLRQHREYPNVKSRHVKKDKCQMLEKALINNSQRMFRRLTHQLDHFLEHRPERQSTILRFGFS